MMIAAAALLLFAQLAEPPRAEPAPAASEQQEPRLSSATPLLELLSERESFDVLQKHIPQIIRFLDAGVIPAPPRDFTVRDFRNVPEAQVSEKDIQAIDADLAKL